VLDPANSALIRNFERFEEFYATHLAALRGKEETGPDAPARTSGEDDDGS
jgi:hypothetical protein